MNNEEKLVLLRMQYQRKGCVYYEGCIKLTALIAVLFVKN